MLRLTCNISIGDHVFDFVNSVSVKSSFEEFTDTCTIVLPKKITFKGKPIVEGENSIFKIGDKVTVQLGYDYNFRTVFTGYITNLKAKTPLEIECMDSMYLFKKKTITKSYKTTTLKSLIGDLVNAVDSSIKYSVDMDVTLKNFRINKATPTQVFEELKKGYGINTFFRDGVLYTGFFYSQSESNYRKTVDFKFKHDIISDDLTFKTKDNSNLKIKAISIDSSNKKIEYEVGTGDEERTIHAYNLSIKELQAFAKNQLEQFSYTGFEGNFEAFGEPFVRHGDAANLIDPEFSERNGKYLIKGVERTFDGNGYRQRISLHTKVSK